MFNAGVQCNGRYLLIVASGGAELPELCALAAFAATIAEMRGCGRVLLDLLALRHHLSTADYLELGLRVSGTLSRLERVAAVAPAALEGVAIAGLFEDTPLKLFGSLEQANDWLCESA